MGLRAFRFRGSGFKMFSCLGLSAVVRQGVVAFFVIRVSVEDFGVWLGSLGKYRFWRIRVRKSYKALVPS